MNGSLDTLDFKRGFRNPFSTLKHPILPHQRSQGNQIYPLNFSGENLFGCYLHKANFFINGVYIQISMYTYMLHIHIHMKQRQASQSQVDRLDVWMSGCFPRRLFGLLCALGAAVAFGIQCAVCRWSVNFDEFGVCFFWELICRCGFLW